MGFGGALLNAITGNTKSAVLVVHDTRSAASGAQQQGAGGIMGMTKAKLNVSKLAAKIPTMNPNSDKVFKVQFNPESLQLDALNDEPISRTSAAVPKKGQNAPNELNQITRLPSIDLTVTLVFDDVSPTDCFEHDTGGLSLNAVAGGIADIFLKHSVRDEVEALIAALRNRYTRGVCFSWADFQFEGNIESINAQYTMFSRDGEPVRANVTLRIQQDLKEHHLQDWYGSFQDLFQGGAFNAKRW